ncbi:MAG: hypothetical protein KA444_02160 [Bacteroidia bacterium]|nr:hypothetical protein [Bacteroidia bacterium]
MTKSFIEQPELNALRIISGSFGEESNKQKIDLLKQLSAKAFKSVRMMLKYQEILLFLSTHPDSKEMFLLAESELLRLNLHSKQIMKSGNETKKYALSGSGLYSTYFLGCFSHAMNSWLLKTFFNCTSFNSFGDSDFTPQELLGLSLLPVESWLLENLHMPEKKWRHHAGGMKSRNSLAWILESMEQADLPVSLKDILYDSLKLYISFDIKDQLNASSLLRTPKGKIYFHTEPLIKKFSIEEILKNNIGNPLTISINDILEYIRVSRFALLHLSRETDTVTYVEPEGLEVFDLDRGLSIAFFYLPPQRRNALDAYVGYMVYKNRIPCAYGGAWIFGNKAKIGLNIFSSFRGGESAYIFSQIIRTYKKRFQLRYFEAEPYQIGKDNPEGILSGAFWFYYKLGFRPHQVELRSLADNEFTIISSDKKYKTPASTLKKLANSMMFLDTKNPGSQMKEDLPDSLRISGQISQFIAEKFQGDRTSAMEYFTREVKKKSGISKVFFKTHYERVMFETLLPLLYFLCVKKSINKKETKQLISLVRAKASSTELIYTQQTRDIQIWIVNSMKNLPSFADSVLLK